MSSQTSQKLQCLRYFVTDAAFMVHARRATKVQHLKWDFKAACSEFLQVPLETAKDNPPAQSRLTYNTLPRAVSRQVLITSKNGDCPASLGKLFHCLITLTVEYFFLSLNRISCISIFVHCFLSCHQILLRRLWFCI